MSYLGIDVGSISASLVLMDKDGTIKQKAYVRHHGEPAKAVRTELEKFPLGEVKSVVRTGTGGKELPLPGEYIDSVVAMVEGVKKLAPTIRNIIYIGGGSFSLTQLTPDGRYHSCRVNSACASGTGAFLDQQALRLQTPPAELARKAMSYEGKAPGVATRCAVFAKSDMIHLQQEGYSTDAIAAGLCTGLGNSTVDGLLSGHKLEGKTAVVGGVARNSVVVGAVSKKLGVETMVPAEPELAGAMGAAIYAAKMDGKPCASIDLSAFDKVEDKADGANSAYMRPPLELKLSKYPDFKYYDYYINDEKSEVALLEPRSGSIPVAMGIDIGSTSTKAALLDSDSKMVAWVYRKTAGDPIRAVQKVFRALQELEKKRGISFEIKGVGTTGSGRKMIQAVVGADIALNEITAHARAAAFLDPEVDTILELGGQDAKFTQLQKGVVYNSVMNYVCAAGTGSFVEEQSLKLGLPLTDFAEQALGVECPKTSDRCTVYMERDLDLLLAKGWSKRQVAAAVLHSVRDNYLNKVVAGLQVGNHVCFQGATARNKALVAAFEVELGVPIRVSPYCHVTGALGMALYVHERCKEKTKFKGLSFADAEVKVTYEVCELCHNRCNLSIIQAGEETVAWGLKCGRDYDATKPSVRKAHGYDFLRQRELAWHKDIHLAKTGPKIGIPRSLSTFGYLPMWRAFFQKLGCQTVVSPRGSEKIMHQGLEITTAEYCAPVVMSHGHIRHLIVEEKVDHLFLPYMIREDNANNFTDAHFCCYLQAHPGVIASLEGIDLKNRMMAPVIQLNLAESYTINSLQETVGNKLGKSRAEIVDAWHAGLQAQHDFAQEARKLGQSGLAQIEKDKGLGIVVVGRPYNALDPGMTLDLPRKIAEMGYNVLYLDMLPLEYGNVKNEFGNMYWSYGQKILAAADYIAQHDNLFGVYFTNFMCGPDSYILTYFKEIMGKKEKPYIVLQFDGHGADAGYLTRIEAALESFHAWKGVPRPVQVEEAKSIAHAGVTA